MWLMVKCENYDDSMYLRDELIEQGADYLRRLMQGWTCFMWGYAEISGIIEAYNRIQRMPPSDQKTSLLNRFDEGDLSLLNKSRVKSPFFKI